MTDESAYSNFHEQSYQRHRDLWRTFAADPSTRRLIESWFDETTVDFWRHRRMYEAARHLGRPEDRWLTIGDGQFGLDSVRLRARGVGSVLPTDIADATLREAKASGKIDDYGIENAEHLSFPERSFDFAFCKEAFHHFPRPYLALYEMLRVCRKGVILVEPQDQKWSLLRRTIYIARKILGRQRHFDQNRYEEAGNYIYSISPREMEKVCLGINLPCFAFKGLSDYYIEGGEFERATLTSAKFLRMIGVVWLHNFLVRLGASKHNVLMCCIFKEKPSQSTVRVLRRAGWKVVELPTNPHANTAASTVASP